MHMYVTPTLPLIHSIGEKQTLKSIDNTSILLAFKNIAEIWRVGINMSSDFIENTNLT